MDYDYTSKYVVPHNVWLLERSGCHIYVEICSSLKVIKYLLLYPFKGDTRVMGSTQKSNNEVSHYEDLRTVGASEDFLKIYKFPLRLWYPTVTSLPIHLEDQVYFEDETNFDDIQNNPSVTQLTPFFI